MNQGYTKLSARLKGFISADKAEIFIGRLTYCDRDKKSNHTSCRHKCKKGACQHKVQITRWNILRALRCDDAAKIILTSSWMKSRANLTISLWWPVQEPAPSRALPGTCRFWTLQRRAFDSRTEFYISASRSANNSRQRTSINSPWSERSTGRPAFRASSPPLGRERSRRKVHRVICVFLEAFIDFQIIRTRTRARWCGTIMHPRLPRIQILYISHMWDTVIGDTPSSHLKSANLLMLIIIFFFYIQCKARDRREVDIVTPNFTFSVGSNASKSTLKNQLIMHFKGTGRSVRWVSRRGIRNRR